MSVKLKPFVHVAPIADGVYFGGPRSQFVISGWAGLFQIVDHCVPLLAHGTTESELVDSLGTERARPVVQCIVAGLREHGMLLAREDPATATDVDGADRYPNSVKYLEAMSDKPDVQFARIRRTRVAVHGPSASVQVAVDGMRAVGFADVCTDGSLGADADGILLCVRGAEELADLARLPGAPDALVVPVLLDDLLMLAGPVVRRDAVGEVAAVWERVSRWALARAEGAVPRPVADSLVVALGGHLLFDTVCALGTDSLHVVHGGRLEADQVELSEVTHTPPGGHFLASVPSEQVPLAAEVIASIVDISQEWTGLFTRGPGEEVLPQMPVALREVQLRSGPEGCVATWGPDQETATMSVAVDGLRAIHAAPAGLTRERWLLDGALRLLALQAEPVGELSATDLNPDARRAVRALAELGRTGHRAVVHAVPGIDWRLVAVSGPDGEFVAQAWAPDTTGAAMEAYATATALAQLESVGQSSHVTTLRTDRLVYGEADEITLLRNQVVARLAAEDRQVEGRATSHDLVLGILPFWAGPVRFTSTTTERY